MLNLKNVEVRYGGVRALKGISLDVAAGSITTLIGANGAGKSTCLKAISGLVHLTSGEIWFEDKRIDGMKPDKVVRLGIGHVPEGKRLFLEMSVYDNLITGAYLRRDKAGIAGDLEKIYEYFPVLKKAARRSASDLSGGEQQMLAIGRGLMCNPRLLLLDEPSLGLSPLVTQEVGEIIARIATEGVSILLIEQNASMALKIADKGYVMEVGVIALEDDAKNLQYNEHVRKAYLGLATTEDDVVSPAHTPAHEWYPGQGGAASAASRNDASQNDREGG
jgi:branched-chain amino acid transport system ATP-binding protein